MTTRECIMIKLWLGHVEAGFKACDILECVYKKPWYSSFLIHIGMPNSFN